MRRVCGARAVVAGCVRAERRGAARRGAQIGRSCARRGGRRRGREGTLGGSERYA
jgi:hypothetical protein